FVSTLIMESDYRIICFRTIMSFIHFYGAFYLNIQLLAAFVKRNKDYRSHFRFLLGVGLTTIFVIFSFVLTQFLINKGYLPNVVTDDRMQEVLYSRKAFLFIPFVGFVIFAIVHFFQQFVILAYATKQSEIELVRLQSANAETTNQLLKQQIQPHFLFNALNTLNSLIKKQPELANDYLLHLSDFLRASITGHRTDTVLMEEELKLCDNYMEMQQLRFGEALVYQVEIAEEVQKKYIVPFFSLQPLLENAIKHNELTKKAPLIIHLFIEGDYIYVKNNLKLKNNVESSTGNGLTNLRERYRILFQEEIEITQNDQEFIVRLKLIENENYNH